MEIYCQVYFPFGILIIKPSIFLFAKDDIGGSPKMKHIICFILIFTGILFIIKIVTTILQYLDLQIDYSNKKNLGDCLQEIEGKDYLIVPYFMWQKGKLREIKKRFSEYYTNPKDGKTYKLGIIYERCAHEKDDIILPGLHRDYRAAIILEDKSTTNIGTQNIIHTIINGDGNQVTVQQSAITDITTMIQKIINQQNNLLSEIDKDFLELFIYKLKDNAATKRDADKVLEILMKLTPLATSVIDLVKNLFT